MSHLYEELRPHPQQLRLLLRAAVADTGDGGPWLYVIRSYDRKVTLHHISLTEEPTTETRLMMISGEQALAYAVQTRFGDVLNPTMPEIRGLMVHTMTMPDAAMWARNYQMWYRMADTAAHREKLVRRVDDAAAVVRGLRWQLAEQWLGKR